MNKNSLQRRASALLAVAALWSFLGSFGVLYFVGTGMPLADEPVNPCNPCNPVKAAGTPKAAAPQDDWADYNPCNPTKAAAANPCNPTKAAAANPCNPCGGGAPKVRLQHAMGYIAGTFDRTTGFVFSQAHGNRLVVTYISSKDAAEIYRRNARMARSGSNGQARPYPPGTIIVNQSYVPNADGSPRSLGPVYVMKKEQAGFDPEGGDWRYDLAKPDLTMAANGAANSSEFCRTCHSAARALDHVFARDR